MRNHFSIFVAAIDAPGGVRLLTIKYKDGEKKVAVTPQTSIVAFEPGNVAELKSGRRLIA